VAGRAPRGEAGRSAVRPAASRRTAAYRTATRTKAPRPRGRFTGRAAILALVLSALVLAYAYPVRTYFAQRAELERVEREQAAQRARIEELAAQREMWNDPMYVAAQARERLQYVRPDETPYVVVVAPDPADSAADSAGEADAEDERPWFGELWSTLEAADGDDGEQS